MLLVAHQPTRSGERAVARGDGAVDRALKAAAADDAVRAVLLTGSGERVFCAGVDVKEHRAGMRRRTAGNARTALRAALHGSGFPKPLVAVLNGIASGGGAMLALVADVRIASDAAAIALPEITLGIPTFSGAALVAISAAPRSPPTSSSPGGACPRRRRSRAGC